MIAIFDFFGVVCDWRSEYVVPQWTEYAKISEVEFESKTAEYLDLCEAGKISMDEMWAGMGKKLNVDPSGLEEIFESCFQKSAKLNDGVVALVQKLPDVFLLSNQFPLHAELAKQHGWFSYFKKLFLSFELGYRKPGRAAYEAVLKELNVKPEDTVFIDDKDVNVKGAEKLGMKGILYKNPEQLRVDLEKIYNMSLHS